MELPCMSARRGNAFNFELKTDTLIGRRIVITLVGVVGDGCTGENVESEVVPVQAMKAYRVSRGTAPLILNLDARRWSTSCPNRFNPGKQATYPLNRRLGGPQRGSGRFSKYSVASVGIRTPNPSHYTDYVPLTLNFTLGGLQLKHAEKHGCWVLQHRVQPRKIVTELASPDTH
jgi:hypothetical protein